MKSVSQLKKELSKGRRSDRLRRQIMQKEIASLQGKDKIHYDMSILTASIKSTQNDLDTLFKGHRGIQQKHDDFEKQLKQKEEELKKNEEEEKQIANPPQSA